MKAFITLQKAQQLEKAIGWLSNYTPIEGEVHHIGADIDTVDEGMTALLNELGSINKRREEILKIIQNKVA